jgi:hypothetical protein
MTIARVAAGALVVAVLSTQLGKHLRNCEFIFPDEPPRYELPLPSQELRLHPKFMARMALMQFGMIA